LRLKPIELVKINKVNDNKVEVKTYPQKGNKTDQKVTNNKVVKQKLRLRVPKPELIKPK